VWSSCSQSVSIRGIRGKCGVNLPHEANTEQTFSTSGVLSDVNMDPTHLGRLVYVSKKWYLYADNISVKTLWEIYIAKYGVGGRLGKWEEEIPGSPPTQMVPPSTARIRWKQSATAMVSEA
jgi:hypothetical protein